MNTTDRSDATRGPSPEESVTTTLVVYESMWGNTEQVARALAAGLAEHGEVQVVDVVDAPDPSEDHDLVVAGGPTHAFSMSRRRTRDDAVRQGAPREATGIGLRDWLDRLPSGHHAVPVATFDTRVDKVRHLPGSAARSAARTVRRLGYEPVSSPHSFYVEDMQGPLVEGELERAREWGRELAGLLMARTR